MEKVLSSIQLYLKAKKVSTVLESSATCWLKLKIQDAGVPFNKNIVQNNGNGWTHYQSLFSNTVHCTSAFDKNISFVCQL